MAANNAEKGTALTTTLIVVLLLSLVGAGIGFAVGFVLLPGKDAEAGIENLSAPPGSGGEHKAANPGAVAATAPGDNSSSSASLDDTADPDLKIIAFPPVLTTLAKPEGKWIRLEGSVLMKPGGDKSPELLAEQTGEWILAYLRTVRLDELQGPSGFLSLRDDLNTTVVSLSKGEVHGLLIHGLLIE